ncbi:hypothetical protein O6H91_03G008600 [Diphasiastrum complanatum]|uniref:Uncharacterized protein n=1 Tax=Diphasiastrum complanatum TaxID=34168 RepID=A0ACC2E388_DIPCM|nr:hypothetical protein O6H91_Y267400 [Diphasiastrum complanatum]KAJ7560981.1 hypothetical protein O6H91_03G008600 [Diphasiastrum complanatum]
MSQLSDSDIEAMIAQFPRWKLSDDKKSISRSFVAKDFVEAMKFFNQVAEAAEAQNHHPDLHLTRYRCVKVILSTHAIHDLSAQDFELASKIDKIDVKYSPKWLRENPSVL